MADKDEPGAVPNETPASSRVTPVDVQQKQFRLAFRGYHEREVDEFLDQVTEELARLHAANRRLEEELSAARTGVPISRASGGSTAESDQEAARIISEAEARAAALLDEARARADSVATGLLAGERPDDEALVRFLGREREFLQRLAGLIQDHAASVKRDVRATREAAAPPPPPLEEEPQEWTAPGSQDDVVAEAAPVAEPVVEPLPPVPEPVVAEAAWTSPEAEAGSEPEFEETDDRTAAWASSSPQPAGESVSEPRPAWDETPTPSPAPSVPSWSETEQPPASQEVEPEPSWAESTDEPPAPPEDEPTPDQPLGTAEPEAEPVAEATAEEPAGFETTEEPEPSLPEDPPWARIVRPVWEPPAEPAQPWREPEAVESADEGSDIAPEASSPRDSDEADRDDPPPFEQPTLMGGPSEPADGWRTEEQIGGPGEDAESEEDRSLRELFWGEEG